MKVPSNIVKSWVAGRWNNDASWTATKGMLLYHGAPVAKHYRDHHGKLNFLVNLFYEKVFDHHRYLGGRDRVALLRQDEFRTALEFINQCENFMAGRTYHVPRASCAADYWRNAAAKDFHQIATENDIYSPLPTFDHYLHGGDELYEAWAANKRDKLRLIAVAYGNWSVHPPKGDINGVKVTYHWFGLKSRASLVKFKLYNPNEIVIF